MQRLYSLRCTGEVPPNGEELMVVYVKEQLNSALRDRPEWRFHMKLDPAFSNVPNPALGLQHHYWKLFRSDDDFAYYLLSLPPDLSEFIIWYGNGFPSYPKPPTILPES